MDNEVNIPKRTAQSWLLCTFRYALGRRTYISSECQEWLEEYWDILPVGYQEQVHRDIRHAIECNMAGDPCDVESWKKVLKLKIKEEQDK